MPRRENGHRTARRLYPSMGGCENIGCEKPAVERHHIDGNTFNNDRSNIMFLCRSCHMKIDGRLTVLNSNHPKPQPPKLCLNCGNPSKPLRRGRCHACNEYLRRHNAERPYSKDGRIEKTQAKKDDPCLRCGRPAGIVGNPVRGYCRSCYTILSKKKKLGKHNLPGVE